MSQCSRDLPGPCLVPTGRCTCASFLGKGPCSFSGQLMGGMTQSLFCHQRPCPCSGKISMSWGMEGGAAGPWRHTALPRTSGRVAMRHPRPHCDGPTSRRRRTVKVQGPYVGTQHTRCCSRLGGTTEPRNPAGHCPSVAMGTPTPVGLGGTHSPPPREFQCTHRRQRGRRQPGVARRNGEGVCSCGAMVGGAKVHGDTGRDAWQDYGGARRYRDARACPRGCAEGPGGRRRGAEAAGGGIERAGVPGGSGRCPRIGGPYRGVPGGSKAIPIATYRGGARRATGVDQGLTGGIADYRGLPEGSKRLPGGAPGFPGGIAD